MKKINRIIIKHPIDSDPDLSWLGEFSNEKGEFAIEHDLSDSNTFNYFNADNVENMRQAKQNYERMIDYDKSNWGMIGIKAEAEIATGTKGWQLLNTITSGGLWGMETDCDDDIIEGIENEQLDELKDVLRKLGFSKLQIEKAPIEREE